jgi:hypothetical protein
LPEDYPQGTSDYIHGLKECQLEWTVVYNICGRGLMA